MLPCRDVIIRRIWRFAHPFWSEHLGSSHTFGCSGNPGTRAFLCRHLWMPGVKCGQDCDWCGSLHTTCVSCSSFPHYVALARWTSTTVGLCHYKSTGAACCHPLEGGCSRLAVSWDDNMAKGLAMVGIGGDEQARTRCAGQVCSGPSRCDLVTVCHKPTARHVT